MVKSSVVYSILACLALTVATTLLVGLVLGSVFLGKALLNYEDSYRSGQCQPTGVTNVTEILCERRVCDRRRTLQAYAIEDNFNGTRRYYYGGSSSCETVELPCYLFTWYGYIVADPQKRNLSSQYERESHTETVNQHQIIRDKIDNNQSLNCHYHEEFTEMNLDSLSSSPLSLQVALVLTAVSTSVLLFFCCLLFCLFSGCACYRYHKEKRGRDYDPYGFDSIESGVHSCSDQPYVVDPWLGDQTPSPYG